MKVCYLTGFTLICPFSHSFSLLDTNMILQKWRPMKARMFKSSFGNKYCLCLAWSCFACFLLHCQFNHQNFQTSFEIKLTQMQVFSWNELTHLCIIFLSIQSSSIAKSRIYAYYDKVNKLVLNSGVSYASSTTLPKTAYFFFNL